MRHGLIGSGPLSPQTLDIEINATPSDLNDLQGLVLMVLGTDARWKPGYPKPPKIGQYEGDKKGWCGDALPIGRSGQLLDDRVELGTCLWTLRHAPLTDRTVELAERAVKEGLEWLSQSGLTRDVDGIIVTAERRRYALAIRVEIYGPDDESLLAQPYEHLWIYGGC